MIEIAVMIVLLDSGAELRTRAPWTKCLSIYREWRHFDAGGRGRMVATDRTTGEKRVVREVRCEDAKAEAPTS